MDLVHPHTPPKVDHVPGASSQTPHSKTSGQSAHSIPRSQADLMSILVDELHDAVFESPSLLNSLYPLKNYVANEFEEAINALASEYFPSSSLLSQTHNRRYTRQDRGLHSTSISQLDPSDERKNYPVIQEIFNSIVTLVSDYSTFHSGLTFIEYDKCTTDQADGQGALKPDLVGMHGGHSRDRYAWSDIHVAVEIKGTWSTALKQAATYGRSMMEQDKRWYSVVIVYNHVKQKLRFTFYNRCGLFVTPAFSLTTLEGFKTIARGLVGMMYRPRHEAGIDEHHLVLSGTSYIYLPGPDGSGHWWRVCDLLCQRICVRGRATHVYSMLAVEKDREDMGSGEGVGEVTRGLVKLDVSPSSHSIPANAITVKGFRQGPVTRSAARSQPASQGKANPRLSSNHSRPSKSTKGLKDIKGSKGAEGSRRTKGSRNLEVLPLEASSHSGSSQDPAKSTQIAQSDAAILDESPVIRSDTVWPHLSTDGVTRIVLKESWPYRDRAMLETQMFLAVQGRHGIPDVIGSVSYPDILHVFTSLKDCKVCEDFSEVYSNSQESCPQPELRALVRMVCATQGKSLMGFAHKPKRLVKAIIDSMIGHMQLFLEGYLHRDVTIGNVLARHDSQERTSGLMEKNAPVFMEQEFDFLRPSLRNCLGFIIDGDLAIHWKKARTPAKHRSGTLPFISYRVLRAWSRNRPVLQTAIDDLESFVWVLLWAALHSSKEKTITEAQWIKGLSSDDIVIVADKKSVVIDDPWDVEDFSESIEPLLPLFMKWFALSKEARIQLDLFLKGWRADAQSLDEESRGSDFFSKLEGLCLTYYQRYLETAVKFLDTCKEA